MTPKQLFEQAKEKYGHLSNEEIDEKIQDLREKMRRSKQKIEHEMLYLSVRERAILRLELIKK